MIENRAERWVTSQAVLAALGKTWDDVRAIHNGALAGFSDEPDVNLETATVSPYPVPLYEPVSVIVSAIDINSGTALCRAQEPCSYN